jgi:leader peptidase (prepilin peptidase)/N-methyltransferase
MEIYAGIIIFVFGIIIGSFLNVCILRLPENRSIVNGPSSCPGCGTRLKALDLVPVFSYIVLRGKCRYCKKKISAQYPAVEFLTGALLLLLYIRFGFTCALPAFAALVCVLIVLTLIDWRHMIIPNGLVIVMFVIGVLQLAASFFVTGLESWLDYVIGFLAGGVPLLLIALFCSYVLKKEAFGGGDIKLMAAAGLIIGWKFVITSYIIGIVTGAVFSVILLSTGRKKRGDEIPFGPFLSLGITASIFFGNELINWYLGLMRP